MDKWGLGGVLLGDWSVGRGGYGVSEGCFLGYFRGLSCGDLMWGFLGVLSEFFKVLIFQSVSKKTTHRSVKKWGFHLWFFPPPNPYKIPIFRCFLLKLDCAIIWSQGKGKQKQIPKP